VGKRQKVVIDTNIFISAFGWGRKPYKIMELLEKGRFRNCLSEEILAELIKSLAYPKLQFSSTVQINIIEFILAYSDIYEVKERLNITYDPDDNKFIECALSAKAKVIITGDKSLLSLQEVMGIRIIRPEDFLQILKVE
jgi:putative PIN family toxin of toxin-antitoxin system